MSLIFSVILFYFACAFLRPLVVGGGSRIRAVVDSDNLEVGRLQINSGPMIDATGIGEIEIKNAVNTGIICAGIDTVNGSYLGTKTAQDLRVLVGYSEKARYLTTGEYGVGVLPIANEGLVQVGSTGGTTRANGVRIGDVNLFRKGANILAVEGVAGSNVRLDVARSTGVIAHIHAQAAAVQFGSQSAHELALVTSDTARFRLSSAGDFHFAGGTPVARPAYGAPTGTATRTTFATGTVTLPQLAERVKALVDDLRANGLLA